MLKFFVTRPITTLMFVMFWVVLGLVSFPKMNIERTPSVDFPMVTATFVYPGAEPAEIESQVIKKAEDAVSQVASVKKITSQAYENGGYVMVEFNLGVNVNDKASEVKTKIDALAEEFPSALKKPVVEKLNPLQESVADIVLRGGDARDLEKYVDDILSNKITAINGVASVSVFGGRERAVRIQMDPDQMASRGVTIVDIVSALGNKNLNVPGGKIESGNQSSNVRFIGEFRNVAEIENLQITTMEGQKFRVSDVATVVDSARDISTGARYNGDDVVIVSVVKSSDGNSIKISKELQKRLPQLQADMQTRFQNGQMQIVSDSSISVLDDTYGTIWGIVLGIIFTIIVLLVFTRNWRSTIIAGAVIPASLLAGFFFMSNAGFTINSMTLLAYSSALGTLVSNAIILIESALQEMQHGNNPQISAIEGTKKVAVPILAGVGTNIVVFLPLAFMGGIAGQFMIQFGMTVVYLTILSLMFSFTLAPMMIAKFLRLTAPAVVRSPVADDADVPTQKTPLRRWFDYQYRHPGRVVLGAFVILVASAQLMGFVGNEFSPATDTNEITITARAPMGATYEKSEQIAMQIENAMAEFPDVVATTIKIGERGLHNIKVKLQLAQLGNPRSISDKELARQLLPRLAQIPDLDVQIKTGAGMSSSVSSDMVLNVYGEDDAKREAYAYQVMDMINSIPEVQTAVFALPDPNNEIQFIPDQDKMSAWGVSNAYAGTTLRAALYGNDNYKYKENGDEYPIVLEFAKPFKTAEMFDNVYVNSQRGMVALSQLGQIVKTPATRNISRLDKGRVTEIDINIGKSTMGPVQQKIQAGLDAIDWENGYTATFAGMSETQSETTGEIGRAFLLATILTIMLLAAILNSGIHPITIATSILTSFAGVFIMLFLSGASMNVGGMLAFVMLVGLVVNNNILVLEPTVKRISNGAGARIALWAELTDKKNMVLMTSIAIITGMLPQLWSTDGMKTAMAAVMIGGMAASLIWTFALTPALFFMMDGLQMRLKKLFNRKHQK
ncbi:MAG: efflux RND transporter permease subunit [Alphaproteobacteria bacterium]|nr:efflux RND transporter permease subunit [Alphaproteobacteria bacterium]